MRYGISNLHIHNFCFVTSNDYTCLQVCLPHDHLHNITALNLHVLSLVQICLCAILSPKVEFPPPGTNAALPEDRVAPTCAH